MFVLAIGHFLSLRIAHSCNKYNILFYNCCKNNNGKKKRKKYVKIHHNIIFMVSIIQLNCQCPGYMK